MAQTPVTVRFWGVRGSVPTPGASTNKVGGNTACVEVDTGGEPILIDAGTGLREFGRELLKKPPAAVHIFLSHYHWDHMLGLPFFPPVFGGKMVVNVYGEKKDTGGPREAVMRQFANPHFPVDFKVLEKTCRFHDLQEGDGLKVGKTSIKVGRLNHPQGAVSYRVTASGKSMVYASDHEHDGQGDASLLRFSKGADLMVYDAMYTGASYAQGKAGWGHSTWEEGCRVAEAAGIRHLMLYHHDPIHDDKAMAAIERGARKLFKGAQVAREGLAITL